MIMRLVLVHLLLPAIWAHLETLHFESACLQSSALVNLNLQCSQYERIQIVRIIYGYTKQTSSDQCQFSIYDCIQEGASQNILLCNGQQTCSIHLTKSELLATTVTTPGVPVCPDFNYVQVNFACLPDSKDICDRWKDEGPLIHLSHTFSKDRQFNRCHCKVRSSMPNGQVLLQAREINRQYGSFKSLLLPKMIDYDCKKTTYVEIATDRSERKCMDMFPSNGNALFGSGSHNFSLTYVKNDPFAELFFYFELKASPAKKDHTVQIICNWARRPPTTTSETSTSVLTSTTNPLTSTSSTSIISTTTTISMQRGGKLSRLDLIRHRTPATNEEEEEEESASSSSPPTTTTKIKNKKKRKKSTTTEKPVVIAEDDEDDEWSKILSLASVEPPSAGKQIFSLNNRSYVSASQASTLLQLDRSSSSSSASSSNVLLLVFLLLTALTIVVLLVYCLRVKRPDCFQRAKLNTNLVLLFCCEAGKLFCGNGKQQKSRRASSTMPDYQSSEYYMTETGLNNITGRTNASIYDGGGSKSIYSIDYDDDESEYEQHQRRHEASGVC